MKEGKRSMKMWIKIIVLVSTCILIVFIIFFYQNVKENKKMYIGYSAVDITPPIGVELCGYGYYPDRKSRAVNDALFARGIMFSRGGNKYLLLNCDLISLSQLVVEETKQKLKDELGIDKRNILILSTHTHSGPNTCNAEGIGERDETYVKSLSSLLAKAGKSAYKSAREVKKVKQIEKELSEIIGFNRADLNGPVNNELSGMAFFFDDAKPVALLSYGCHPVTLGPKMEISADYPGCVVKEMNNAGYDCLFLNGFCGDIDPVSNIIEWGSGTQETIDEYGKIIAGTFLSALQGAEIMVDLSMDSYDIPVKLNMINLNADKIDKLLENYEGEKTSNPGKYKLVHVWASKMKENLKSNENPFEKTLNVQALKIGKVIIVGFPAEMFTALSFPLKSALPDMNVITLGNANAPTGYIATSEKTKEGLYEGFESNYLYLTFPLVSGEGERLADTVAKELKLKLSK